MIYSRAVVPIGYSNKVKPQNIASLSIIQNRVKLINTNFCCINLLFFHCIQRKFLTVKLCMYMVGCQVEVITQIEVVVIVQ